MKAAAVEEGGGPRFKGIEGCLNSGWRVSWFPFFVSDVEFGMVASIGQVGDGVASADVAAESVEVDGVVGLSVKRETEA